MDAEPWVPVVMVETPDTYRITSLTGIPGYTTHGSVDITGNPTFEDGDLVMRRYGKVVKAFARGVWTSVEIVE